jgi:hypothetical protein
MKSFLVIAIITLASGFSAIAQEHTPRTPVTTPTPVPRTTPARTTPPSNAVDTSGWIRFTSDMGRFSVLMPEIPTEQTPTTTPTEHGPYTTHLFITKAQKSIFLIGWVDYDPNFNFDRQQELEANRDNFVNGVKATLMDSRPLTIDGYQAIEFIAETEERRFKSRVYLVGRRPYQMVVVSAKGEDDSVSVSRFFNSFKVSRVN